MTIRHLLAAVMAACACAGAAACGPSIDEQACTTAARRFASCPYFKIAPECSTDPIINCYAQCALGFETCDDLQGAFDGTGECNAQCDCLESGSDCSTPLVLSFDGAPVRFARGSDAFDLGLDMSVATDWPTSATPWLALDRNGNGVIDDGTELFGSGTRLRTGPRAPDGFTALRELDSNGDGWITAADEAWPRLLLWSDHDGDRVSSAGEIAPLASAGVTAIELGAARAPRCDARGNCEGERARFVFHTADEVERTGAVIDVYLRFQRE